jgi:hypothetical protein
MDAVRGRLEQLVILSEKLGRWNHVANGLQTAGLYVPHDLQLPLCSSRPEHPLLCCLAGPAASH